MAKFDDRRKADYDVTPERFVTVWNVAQSLDEVSEELGMPKPIAAARASNYRRAGVNLKRMPRPRTDALNIEGLNQLAAKLQAMTPSDQKKAVQRTRPKTGQKGAAPPGPG